MTPLYQEARRDDREDWWRSESAGSDSCIRGRRLHTKELTKEWLVKSVPEPAPPVLLDRRRRAREAGSWGRVLDALHAAYREAKSEKYPAISAEMKKLVKAFLARLHNAQPRDYDVYPTERGEIAIEATGVAGKGVLLLFQPAGVLTCFVSICGANRRARYEDTSKLPDAFISDALDELDVP